MACEFSGRVRQAFRDRGHDAWSCDLLPADDGSPYHLQVDALEPAYIGLIGPDFFSDPWDLMIAHPPCTHLASSGARWWKDKQQEQEEAIKFVLNLANAPISRIAIENPIGKLSSAWRKPDQIVQPHYFGHPESKATCLWLKNLPLLHCTDILPKPASGYWENQTPSGQNKLSPSEDRWKLRSITYQGIADAMAEQWGSLG